MNILTLPGNWLRQCQFGFITFGCIVFFSKTAHNFSLLNTALRWERGVISISIILKMFLIPGMPEKEITEKGLSIRPIYLVDQPMAQTVK